jgi:Tfx family DNA-binding protein
MTDETDTETDRSTTAAVDRLDVDDLLERAGFDAETNVLTRRQAEVLALRERGMRQRDIADRLGTSRANVSNVETSARENITSARETVAFAEAVGSPVRVEIPAGTDLFDVPTLVYDACDEAEMKVQHTAPELMTVISDAASDAVQGRAVHNRLLIGVTDDGEVHVRRSTQ